MSTPTMGLTGRDAASTPKVPPPEKGLIPEGLKTGLIFALVLAVAYLLYDNYQFQNQSKADMLKLTDDLKALDNRHKVSESKIAGLTGEVTETQQAVGSTKQELKKTAAQMQAEGQKTKAELSQALSSKADSSQVQAQVQAAKSEADAKIGQVSTEVGGVKTEVGVVKTDLASTKRDLEGTQRQLVDVRETLSAAVAKNASELAELRRKGERDYTEFEIPKRNQLTKIQDIRVVLTRTDPKKGKYNIKIVVDDNSIEKKDRNINEPLAFLVGHNRLRYELVINWVKKESAGGYLSIPKDKSLSAERPAK
jgi:chromosome segregation ATPase